MAKPTGQIYECVEAFSTLHDGVPITVVVGERIREGHPLLRGREMFFQPLTVTYEVEQATKAPGEKRGEKK
jgi:F0F1-type ATP synthase beta subunit